MRSIDIHLRYKAYDASAELDAQGRSLLDQAREASAKAYAPYSGFSVGAAVLLENGEVICGSNQENAAYPSGLCAERTALFFAASKYPGVAVTAMAVSARTEQFPLQGPVFPCGACRQVMVEYESLHHQPMRVLMDGPEGHAMEAVSAADLLPLSFTAEGLKKQKNQ